MDLKVGPHFSFEFDNPEKLNMKIAIKFEKIRYRTYCSNHSRKFCITAISIARD